MFSLRCTNRAVHNNENSLYLDVYKAYVIPCLRAFWKCSSGEAKAFQGLGEGNGSIKMGQCLSYFYCLYETL